MYLTFALVVDFPKSQALGMGNTYKVFLDFMSILTGGKANRMTVHGCF